MKKDAQQSFSNKYLQPPTPGQAGAIQLAKPSMPQLEIERIIGMSQSGCQNGSILIDGSISSQYSICTNPLNGDIAFIAGAFVVVYGMKSNKQEKFLKNERQHPFQCLSYSPNGEYLAAGCQSIRNPTITVWKVGGYAADLERTSKMTYTYLYTLRGHQYSIMALQFSPNSDMLISMGDPHDKGLIVWAIDDQVKNPANESEERHLMSNKESMNVNSFTFSEEHNILVTAGYSHLKFWHLTKEKGSRTLQGQSIDLNKCTQKIFVGVVVHNKMVYCLTSGGHLYLFSLTEKKLKQWMDIQVKRAFAVSFDPLQNFMFCACADGILRIFSLKNLEHIQTITKPPPLGQTNIETGMKKIKLDKDHKSKHADVLSVQCDSLRKRFLAVYSDNMVILWDYTEVKKATVMRTFYSHNGPIYDIQQVNPHFKIGLKGNQEAEQLQKDQCLTRFATCSGDRTLRFWHFMDQSQRNSTTQNLVQKGIFRNAYCKDMSKILFVNNSEDVLAQQFDVFKAKPLDRHEDGSPIEPNATPEGVDEDEEVELDEITMRRNLSIQQAIRCFRLSHDGKQVACGDWYGNIRIHNLQVENMDEIKCIEAHEKEVMSIDMTRQITSKTVESDLPAFKDSQAGYLLVSGSSDSLIQIYDSKNDYEEIQIIEDHESAVTSVRFVEEKLHFKHAGQQQSKLSISLVSGSADKQLLKHTFEQDQNFTDVDPFTLQHSEQFNNKILTIDVAKDASQYYKTKNQLMNSKLAGKPVAGNPYIITGHDKILVLRGTETFSKIWEKHPDPKRKVFPDYLKVAVDDWGQVVVASGTDKNVSIFEAESGKLLARATSGEITTGMIFSQNGKHLITTSSQGVIYVWKLPENVVKLLNKFKNKEPKSIELIMEKIDEDDMEDTQNTNGKNTDREAQDEEQKVMNDWQKARDEPLTKPRPPGRDTVIGTVNDVLAQIGMVNAQVNMIEEKKAESQTPKQPTILKSPLNNVFQNDNKTDVSRISTGGIDFGSDQNKNMPRWALSIVGNSEAKAFGADKATENASLIQEDISIDMTGNHEMENLFNNNLRQIRDDDDTQIERVQGRVDVMETPDGDDEDQIEALTMLKESQAELENQTATGESPIKRFKTHAFDQQDQRSNIRIAVSTYYENVINDGNESAISNQIRKSRDVMSKRSGSIRQSIAGKHFLHKKHDTSSQFSHAAKSAHAVSSSAAQKLETPNSSQQTPKLFRSQMTGDNSSAAIQSVATPVVEKPIQPEQIELKVNNTTSHQDKNPIQSNSTNNLFNDLPREITDLVGGNDGDVNFGSKAGAQMQSMDNLAVKLPEAQLKKEQSVKIININQLDGPETGVEDKKYDRGSFKHSKQNSIASDAFRQSQQSQVTVSEASVAQTVDGSDQPKSRRVKKKWNKKEPTNDLLKPPGVEDVVEPISAQEQQQHSFGNYFAKKNDGDAPDDSLGRQRSMATKKKQQEKKDAQLLEPKETNVPIDQNRQTFNEKKEMPLNSKVDEYLPQHQLQVNQDVDMALPPSNLDSSRTFDSQVMLNSSVNFQLSCEIQRINDSLRNISSILDSTDSMIHINQLGVPSQADSSALGATASKIEASFDSQHPLTVRPQSAISTRTQIQIDKKVDEQLTQSINLWQNMMTQMQVRTSLKDSPLLAETMNKMQKSRTDDRTSRVTDTSLMFGASATQNFYQTQSVISHQTIKEDTKDILEKYSDLLLETLMNKMSKKQSTPVEPVSAKKTSKATFGQLGSPKLRRSRD